jgi:hypothetical protein
MLLHSRIITTSDLSLLQSSLRRPEEQIIKYPKLVDPFETELSQCLHSKYGDISALRKIFIFAKDATAELGNILLPRSKAITVITLRLGSQVRGARIKCGVSLCRKQRLTRLSEKPKKY